MSDTPASKSNVSLMIKRVIGIVTLIILGYLIYPVIFSDVRPEREVDTNTQIPQSPDSTNAAGQAQQKQIVVTQSTLDKELEAHRQKQKLQQEQREQELADKLLADEKKEPQQEQEETKPVDTSILPKSWVIQVVSFKEESKSLVIRDKLLNDGYKAFIQKVELTDSTRYRVLVGPYINPINSKRDKASISKLIATNPVILNY